MKMQPCLPARPSCRRPLGPNSNCCATFDAAPTPQVIRAHLTAVQTRWFAASSTSVAPWDLQLVGGGVETAEQAAAPADPGCPFGQGYYFARPLPFADALRLVTHPRLPLQKPLTAGKDDGPRPLVGSRRYGA